MPPLLCVMLLTALTSGGCARCASSHWAQRADTLAPSAPGKTLIVVEDIMPTRRTTMTTPIGSFDAVALP